MSYWGEYADADEIAAHVYRDDINGTLIEDVVIYLNEAGFNVDIMRGTLEDLRNQVRLGHPVIVFLQVEPGILVNMRRISPFYATPLLDASPKTPHIVLVDGFHKNDKYILCQYGTKTNLAVRITDFDRFWKANNRAMIVATPRRMDG